MRPPYDAALVLGVELDADDAPTEELARRVMAAARACWAERDAFWW